jgi:hypothetical protein
MIDINTLSYVARRIVAARIPDQKAHDDSEDGMSKACVTRACEDELMAELSITRRRAATAIVRVMRERRGLPARWGGRREGAGTKKGAQGPRFREGERIVFGQLGTGGVRRGEIQAATMQAIWIKFDDGSMIGIEREQS